MDDALNGRQPDSGPFEGLRLVETLEDAKQLVGVLHVETDPVVPDEHHRLPRVSLCAPDLDLRLRARPREFVRLEGGIAQAVWIDKRDTDFRMGWAGQPLYPLREFFSSGFRPLGLRIDDWHEAESQEQTNSAMKEMAGAFLKHVYPWFEETKADADYLDYLMEFRNLDHHRLFDVSCLHARLGRMEEAVRYVEKAIVEYEDDGRDWCAGYIALCRELLAAVQAGTTSELLEKWKVQSVHNLGYKKLLQEPRKSAKQLPPIPASATPNVPDIPGLDNFKGQILHSSQYDDGERWSGKRALVIGTGNSGHDIAQDLHSSGTDVTLVQRSSTLVTNIEPSAQLAYSAYNEGTLEDNDLIAASMPLTLARRSHILLTEQSRKLDKELLDGLERVGFKLDFGDEGTGWQFKYLTRGGGYYFNVGCADLVASGAIRLKQFADIDAFTPEGVRMKNGEALAADLIVLATGYKPQEYLVQKLLGEEVAARVGPIWGFGDGQELRNMYARTGQPGLWFIAGSLAQCRINSKYLALQVKAIEEGLLPRASPK